MWPNFVNTMGHDRHNFHILDKTLAYLFSLNPLDYLVDFPPFFCQGRPLLWLPVCFLAQQIPSKRVFSKRKEFAPFGRTKSFLLEKIIFQREGNRFNRVASPESESIHLQDFCMWTPWQSSEWSMLCICLYEVFSFDRPYTRYVTSKGITDIQILSPWELLWTLCMLGKNFSKRPFEIFFLQFLENRIWHVMQIVSLRDNLHEMSDPIF